MRRIIATTIIALAAITVAPANAQQVDAQTKQAVEAIGQKWVEAVNKGDGKAASALFTSDGFIIDVYGKNSGIKLDELSQKVHEMGITIAAPTSDVKSLASGQVLLATGTFNVTYTNNPTTKTAEGNWMRVLVKDGSDWKIVAQNVTRQAPPQPAK
jgi:ketosteroid isomerase-like protein